MDDVEHAIETLSEKRLDRVFPNVDTYSINVVIQQSCQYRLTALQGNFALGGGSTHQYGDTSEFGRILDSLAHSLSPRDLSPTIRTSGTKRCPNFSSTLA